MGLFSRPSSSNSKKKHWSLGSDRWPPQNTHPQDDHYDRPVNGSRKPPHSPDPRTSYQPREQGKIEIFHRDAEELYEEAFWDVTLHTATDYPCTQKELNASGGANRQMVLSKYEKNKTKWFAQPNNGPFLDARITAREVFEHNDPKRTPSDAEDEAISRLINGFKNAGQRRWGPDLAIKVFCDLDKVFFCGRLKGHVCLNWQPDLYLQTECYGATGYLGHGKCVIHLNARTIFFLPIDGLVFVQMFATLLHEMCHAYQYVRALDHGPKGWKVGRPDGHGRNFGTMIHAVNRRAKELLGFEGDSVLYIRHDYALDDDLRSASRQQPPPVSPPHTPRPRRPATPRKTRQERYDDAFKDVSLDSGTDYTCTQSDLDATGGLSRQEYQKDDRGDHKASRKTWFPQPNQGPFTTPRQACLEIL